MILVGFNIDLFKDIQSRYPEKVIIMQRSETGDSDSIIKFLEELKSNNNIYDIVYIQYFEKIMEFLQAVKLDFNFIYNELETVSDVISHSDISKFILNDNFTIEKFLSHFDWYKALVVEDNSQTELTVNTSNLSGHRVKTLQDLIDDESNLTDLDVADVKELQNKLKMGVLLQAKSMLKRVLQLTNILDKLYDELLLRIDNNITTTDTASLMNTTEFISKALSDTNQFIVSLVNNDKIQNFFIIDNSTVINTGNDTYDIDRRERIRKAAEIILNNYDSLAENRLDEVIDPNSVIEETNK